MLREYLCCKTDNISSDDNFNVIQVLHAVVFSIVFIVLLSLLVVIIP